MSNIWDERFLGLAQHVSTWSKDPRTKVGAVLVNETNQVLSVGYNGFPRGVFDLEARYEDRPTKLMFVAHAERNALDNCFTDTRGSTLYVTLPPCNECVKSIIQKGVKRIVMLTSDARPQDNSDIAMTMLAEAGILLQYIHHDPNSQIQQDKSQRSFIF
jgi:dCMP deaminase